MRKIIEKDIEVPFNLGNKRFDQVSALLFTEYSRSRLQQWIKKGDLTVSGVPCRGRNKLVGGEILKLKTVMESEFDWIAQDIPLEIVYEDDDILVVNKQEGLVVHPAAGNPDGTMLNALLFTHPELKILPRAGIVHRLDKDTTGLMVVAKTLVAQTNLVEQLQERSMGREYEAVVMNVMTGGGVVDAPISRHPSQRTKMAVAPEGMGKEAITHYRLLHQFHSHTYIRCKLETGRTHQIRVHLSHLGYPLVGDQTYAGRFKLPKGITISLRQYLSGFKRQALHARELGLWHPVSGEWMSWQSELPEDFQQLLQVLSDNEKYQNKEW
jgi:23S rRNA pseudouridine1911/1915/1917 synthase